MTIKELLTKGTIMLKGEDLSAPKMKARLLLQDVLEKPRQYLIVHDMEQVNDKLAMKYLENIEKVKKGTPIEHITHFKEFMKMNFYVNKNVLIPRQDTEILVEEAIKIAKRINAKKILDLCTGSGIICISIAKNVKNSEITATDISKEALRIAKKNAISNEVQNQITFIESDLFSQIAKTKYDMIISNPPYIKKDVIKKLDKEVQKEPLIALDGGYDGLKFYKKIANKAYEYLKFGGYLCLEIGYNQKESVIEIIEQEEKYNKVYCKKDLCNNDRVIVAKVGE